ncbi:hypothetical protein BAUCODRAFT_30179 [Baudoinia panamericana UAMH 10762]|uniref:Uncharacterized protein n=1 Tax=Baudoinia panamericana (strain UAMH 10762) TaxID=717646 RepID=M2MSD3_BAUPA|nr:uncharacterized protein BAUCODRAFT_30179 [Baudoinia panamericana UAMH 10762]EMC99776.1 hypothetical protein BAUCODRAFT_30179 [Baudoinia panamericana UAMH 10762]
MAAAEYYNPGGGGGMPQSQGHPTPVQRPPMPQGSMSSLPYPVSDAPPPYTLFADQGRPQSHSQPPPMNRPPPSSYAPPPLNGYPQDKPDYKPNYPPNGQYPPQPNSVPYPQSQPPPQQGYPYPNGMPPAMSTVYGNNSNQRPGYPPPSVSFQDNYDDYDKRSRSRSRDGRRHHHHHRHDRPQQDRKKSGGTATFLGAGGGAIIGDLIFPGLGTVGGALLGGLSGHEYGKQRRSYSNPRPRERSYVDDRDYYEDGRDGRGRRR